MSFKTRLSLIPQITLPLVGLVALLAQQTVAAQTRSQPAARGVSPALCGAGDVREPGIQGEVPKGQKANYNCGVRLLGQLPLIGNSVQGVGKCAYVRVGGGSNTSPGGTVHVIDVSDPAKPVAVGSVPVKSASETLRVMVTPERAIMASGSSVYDIKDCLHPKLLGEIKWPPLAIGTSPPIGGGGGLGILPHDLRINFTATKIYASMGLWEADISNLGDPESWKVTDYRCDLAPQVPGPWQELHRQGQAAGINLCDDEANPQGADYRQGGSRFQAALIWPTLSHSLDVNAAGTRVYLGDQKLPGSGNIGEPPRLRVVDVTKRPAKIVSVANGPGHGLDWFQTGGREYVAHSNETGTTGGPNGRGDPCQPYPRPTALGWAFEVIISEVTGDQARNVGMLKLAINEPEFCEVRKASGLDPTVAYHLIDNATNAKFAAVNFGAAGLRIYDIRQPTQAREVAYFNHGPLSHGGVGYYDATRGLIYAAGGTGFWVLEVEPQVKARLGL